MCRKSAVDPNSRISLSSRPKPERQRRRSGGTCCFFASASRTRHSIRGLAGHVARIVNVARLLPQQSFQLSARLINDRRGKLARRLLPLLRQLSHPHIEQRDIFFKPAQRSLHLGDAEVVGQHFSPSVVFEKWDLRAAIQSIYQSATTVEMRKSKERYPSSRSSWRRRPGGCRGGVSPARAKARCLRDSRRDAGATGEAIHASGCGWKRGASAPRKAKTIDAG